MKVWGTRGRSLMYLALQLPPLEIECKLHDQQAVYLTVRHASSVDRNMQRQ